MYIIYQNYYAIYKLNIYSIIYVNCLQVHRTCQYDCHKRCDGIYVWFLFWTNTINKIVPEEDLGGLYWWWYFDCHTWIIGN